MAMSPRDLGLKEKRFQSVKDAESAYNVMVRRLNETYKYNRIDHDTIIGTGTIQTMIAQFGTRRAQVVSVLEDHYLCKLVTGDISAGNDTAHITSIYTASDLNAVRNGLGGRYRLMNDIDLTAATRSGGDYWDSGSGWNPIGDDANPFTGRLDGNGCTISGMFIDRGAEAHVGLFGYVSATAAVKDLTLDDSDVTGLNNVGSLAGQSFGYIYNCHATGTNTITGTYEGDGDDVGGLIGDNDGTVVLSSAAGTVDGHYDVGGLCGDNDGVVIFSWSTANVDGCKAGDIGGLVGDNKGFKVGSPMSDSPNRGTIFGCYATGAVTSSAKIAVDPAGDIGGLVGDNKAGSITNSWATGTVDGFQPQIGGLCGDSKNGDNGLGEVRKSFISNCYATGNVTALGDLPGSGAIGGLVGDIDEAQVVNCYCSNLVDSDTGHERKNKGDFAGDADDAIATNCFYNSTIGLIGSSPVGTGKTTAQLKQQATFTGWDFSEVWSIVEDTSYPTLPAPAVIAANDDEPVRVYPMDREGTAYLSAEVIPKVSPGKFLLVTVGEDGVYYTPVIVHDLGDAIGWRDRQLDVKDDSIKRSHLADTAGGSILGKAVDWDGNGNIDVQVNDNHIGVNASNQLKLIDDSVGKSKLGDDNGATILGTGLDWDGTNKIEVDITEIDLSVVVDDVTIEISGGDIQLKSVTKIFELSYNKASDSDLDDELAGVGAAGAVAGASGQNENGIYGQAMGPDAKQAVVWSGYVPYDYVSGNIVIKCRWCLAADGDAGATDWRWISIWNEVEIADATVIGSETVSGAVDEAVGAGEAQRTMHTITLATISTLTAGDLLTVTLMRDAIHANDDCTKKIMVLDKIHAEFTSTKRGA